MPMIVDVNRVQIGGGHICFRFILTVVMHSAINALQTSVPLVKSLCYAVLDLGYEVLAPVKNMS